MNPLLSTLTLLGIDSDSAQIYIKCLEYGAISVSTLARLLGSKRTTLYFQIEKLVNQGLLITHKLANTTAYEAANIDQLINRLDEEHKKIQTQQDALKELKIQGIASQLISLPNIRYFEGVQSAIAIYQQMKQAQEVAALFDIRRSLTYPEMSIEFIIEAGLAMPTHAREIIVDSDEARHYQSIVSTHRSQPILLLDTTKNIISSDNLYVDDRYIHLSFGERVIGFEIRNKEFLAAQRCMFEALWRQCTTG